MNEEFPTEPFKEDSLMDSIDKLFDQGEELDAYILAGGSIEELGFAGPKQRSRSAVAGLVIKGVERVREIRTRNRLIRAAYLPKDSE